jgi:hypothetical protein
MFKKISKLIKKIIVFFIPYGIHKIIKKSLKKIQENKITNSKSEVIIENFNIPLKDNMDCIILGNGPSLKESLQSKKNYEFIISKPKFCVNSFPITDEFFKLKPEFLVFMDPFFWAENLSEPYITEVINIKENIKKADWNITIIMPIHAKKWNFFIDILSENISIKYINTDTSSENDFIKKANLFKSNKAMPQVQNVLIACLYVGINIGFKNLYIFGADHSWHENLMIDDDNILNIKDLHFYDNMDVKYTTAYSEADLSKIFNMHSFFYALSQKFYGYMELEKYSKLLGSKIFNASAKSYIDAFEKIKIDK